MGQHNLGLHHAHVRKRVAHLGEEYPSKDRQREVVDRLIYVGAFVGPLFTIPQAYLIWTQKTAAGLSLISWASYLVAAIMWLYYGIIHQEKPIIVSNIIWIVLDLLVVVGIVRFG